METHEEVVIVGAGIAGLATAIALKRVGIRSLVLERGEDLRTTGAALGLSPNAWRALDALGVSSKLTSLYGAMQKGYITDVGTGKIREISYVHPGRSVDPKIGPNSGSTSRKETKISTRPVHRTALLEALAEELPAEWIRFSSKLTSIDQTQIPGGGHVVTVRLEDGTIIKSKVLIGCDGVHSIVAEWLGLAKPVHSGRCAIRGLSIYPKGHGLDHQLYQYLDTRKRGGFISLNDKELYWFLGWFTSRDEDNKLRKTLEEMQKDVLEHASNFPSIYMDVAEHSDPSSLSWAPIMFRYPWAIAFGTLRKGGVTVAGDAMHPMTPDLGQGGCCALEDAVVLGRHIGKSYLKNGNKIVRKDMEKVLGEYVNERKWRVTSMVIKSYLSGWIQSAGGNSNWLKKFLMKGVFFRYLGRIFANVGSFDCGELPKPIKND